MEFIVPRPIANAEVEQSPVCVHITEESADYGEFVVTPGDDGIVVRGCRRKCLPLPEKLLFDLPLSCEIIDEGSLRRHVGILKSDGLIG